VVLLYYACIAGCLAPWLMMVAGAIRKTARRPGHRLYRLQMEGLVILLCGMAAAWILFDRHFGVDRARASSLAYWFTHGERGLFWIGQLLVFMAYFLERRPVPGRPKWPSSVKAVAIAGIVAGLGTAFATAFFTITPNLELPWSWAREGWSLGLIPFAAQYTREAWGMETTNNPASIA